MGRIPEETIQTVRDRIDLVELIGRHVTLKKSGNSWWGLCPFHGEKSPSFHVRGDRGFYHCFGCGESGNAFDFLIRHDNLTFPEAVRSLAASCGVEVPETGAGEPGLAAQLVAANEVAQTLYREALAAPAGARARAYLAERGIDAAAQQKFGIGFAPDRWDALRDALGRAKIAPAIGERAGLLRERASGGHYDLLRNRVTFPIHDARGRIVAFGGRALAADQEPKYLNSPETPLFRKREAFYGMPDALEAIRRSERAVVVEGYFDRIALTRAGVDETLATCGTALGEDHGRALRRRVRDAVLLFDGDDAGQRAALRALEVLLPHGLRVRAAALPAGEDPDDYLRRAGPEALRALVDGALPALELAIQRAVQAGCATPWQKADAVAAVAPLLVKVPDAVERRGYVDRLALAVGVPSDDVAAAVRNHARGTAAGEPAPVTAAAPIAGPQTHAERRVCELIRLLVEHPAVAETLDARRLHATAPAGAWTELLAGVLELCDGAEAQAMMTRLEQRFEGDARCRLLAVLADPAPAPDDAERAQRMAHDIASWLDRQQQRAERRELTQQLRSTSGDRVALLREKDREIARRRAALTGGTPG